MLRVVLQEKLSIPRELEKRIERCEVMLVREWAESELNLIPNFENGKQPHLMTLSKILID